MNVLDNAAKYGKSGKRVEVAATLPGKSSRLNLTMPLMSMAIKNAVKIPVLLTGGIKILADADALLNEGAADLIGVGRELLKDAKWEVE